MSYEQMLLRSVLQGEPVRRFMRPNPVAVPPDMSIHQFVDDYLYRYDLQLYPVVTGSQDLVGCVVPSDVSRVPRDEWDYHRIAEVAKPCSEATTVSPDTDALNALAKIRDAGEKELLVTERNHLLAIVTAKDFLNYLAARTKLNDASPR
jgi:CBS-domain-containing membrane protein